MEKIFADKTEKTQCSAFPARYILAILGFLGMTINTAMTVSLSVVLVAMVQDTEENMQSEVACPELVSRPNQTSTIRYQGEFNWDSNTQSQILGAFYYGYIITQIPGGFAAKRYGAKWLIGLCILTTSILTILIPVAARTGVVFLITILVISGLAEGVTVPGLCSLLSVWMPEMERSRISAIVRTGKPIGQVLGMAASGYLIDSTILGGWPSVFYIFGSSLCIWFLLWIFLIYDKPEDHPRISQSELLYIRGNQINKENTKTPWLSLLASRRVWALAVALFGDAWGNYIFQMEIPTFLSNILHFNIKQNGVLSSLPFLMQMLFAGFASIAADKMREKGWFGITTIRKIMNSIAFYGAGISILVIAFVGCQPTTVMVFLCVALGFNGFSFSGIWTTPVDMSPEFAGTIMGITYCFASFAGFLAPVATGRIIINGQTVDNWSVVFTITSAMFFVTGTIYNLFASCELQPWNDPESAEKTMPTSIELKKRTMPTSVELKKKIMPTSIELKKKIMPTSIELKKKNMPPAIELQQKETTITIDKIERDSNSNRT